MVRERAPLAVTATLAGDMSFMPLNRGDRQLDFSRFDVGGLQNARSADQLSAYLFSDRGIYRPGETMHIGAIVKASDWARPLAGVPLEAEVLDARGLAYFLRANRRRPFELEPERLELVIRVAAKHSSRREKPHSKAVEHARQQIRRELIRRVVAEMLQTGL